MDPTERRDATVLPPHESSARPAQGRAGKLQTTQDTGRIRHCQEGEGLEKEKKELGESNT